MTIFDRLHSLLHSSHQYRSTISTVKRREKRKLNDFNIRWPKIKIKRIKELRCPCKFVSFFSSYAFKFWKQSRSAHTGNKSNNFFSFARFLYFCLGCFTIQIYIHFLFCECVSRVDVFRYFIRFSNNQQNIYAFPAKNRKKT